MPVFVFDLPHFYIGFGTGTAKISMFSVCSFVFGKNMVLYGKIISKPFAYYMLWLASRILQIKQKITYFRAPKHAG